MKKIYYYSFLALANDRHNCDYGITCGIPETLNEIMTKINNWLSDGYTIHHLTMKAAN